MSEIMYKVYHYPERRAFDCTLLGYWPGMSDEDRDYVDAEIASLNGPTTEIQKRIMDMVQH